MTFKIFLLKNYTQNKVEKLVPDPFLKSQNLLYIWINSLKFYMIYFQFTSKSWATKIYWNYGADHLILPHIKVFWKKKSHCLIFCMIYEEKSFSRHSTNQISLSVCHYFLRYREIRVLQLLAPHLMMP